MTDKVQKIREGVEKLKSRLIHGACASQIAMETRCKEEAYNEMLAILDSMKEEPVSEELEEAANNALNNVLNTHEIVNIRSCLEMFRFGAEWQKTKDQSIIELAEDHAMLAGMEKMKEQMMKDAFDAEVLENYDGKVIKYDDTILDEKLSNCKVFDKVKVIVIKEK